MRRCPSSVLMNSASAGSESTTISIVTTGASRSIPRLAGAVGVVDGEAALGARVAVEADHQSGARAVGDERAVFVTDQLLLGRLRQDDLVAARLQRLAQLRGDDPGDVRLVRPVLNVPAAGDLRRVARVDADDRAP